MCSDNGSRLGQLRGSSGMKRHRCQVWETCISLCLRTALMQWPFPLNFWCCFPSVYNFIQLVKKHRLIFLCNWNSERQSLMSLIELASTLVLLANWGIREIKQATHFYYICSSGRSWGLGAPSWSCGAEPGVRFTWRVSAFPTCFHVGFSFHWWIRVLQLVSDFFQRKLLFVRLYLQCVLGRRGAQEPLSLKTWHTFSSGQELELL